MHNLWISIQNLESSFLLPQDNLLEVSVVCFVFSGFSVLYCNVLLLLCRNSWFWVLTLYLPNSFSSRYIPYHFLYIQLCHQHRKTFTFLCMCLFSWLVALARTASVTLNEVTRAGRHSKLFPILEDVHASFRCLNRYSLWDWRILCFLGFLKIWVDVGFL